MFDIPLKFVLINPAIDIILFIGVFYILIWKIYSRIIKNNVQKIFWIDLQLTIIFLSLGYINYSGNSVDVFGIEISWFAYIIIVQLLVEGILFASDPKLFKKLFSENKKPPLK